MTRKYAVVKKWKDSPSDVQVIDYFETLEDAYLTKNRMPKSKEYEVEVMKYE